MRTIICSALLWAFPILSFAGSEEAVTRYGKVSVRQSGPDEKALFIERTKLPISDYLVAVERKLEIGERDVLFVSTGSGGNACPAMYVFVVLERGSATVSEPFGNCSDLPKLTRAGDRVMVEFPGRPKLSTTLEGLKLTDGKKTLKMLPVRF